jgi:hypothetical protein
MALSPIPVCLNLSPSVFPQVLCWGLASRHWGEASCCLLSAGHWLQCPVPCGTGEGPGQGCSAFQGAFLGKGSSSALHGDRGGHGGRGHGGRGHGPMCFGLREHSLLDSSSFPPRPGISSEPVSAQKMAFEAHVYPTPGKAAQQMPGPHEFWCP